MRAILFAIAITITASLAGTSGAVSAGEPEPLMKRAEQLLDEGKAVEAAEILRPLADGGEPLAQHYLALALQLGPAEIRDPAEAVRLWTVAGMSGLDEAQWRLGVAYIAGNGVEKDTVTGMAWLIAAAAEDGMAYHLVASASSRAEIEEAHKRAGELRWEIEKHQVDMIPGNRFTAARAERLAILAEAGNATAQYELASMHRLGAPTGQRPMMYWNGHHMPVPGLPEDRGEPNREEAERLYRLAAASGHHGAMYEVARTLEFSDPAQAVRLYERVVAEGPTYGAVTRLARMLLLGRGVNQDIGRANRLLLGVARSRNPWLQADVAAVYVQASAGDLREALMWYIVAERAAREYDDDVEELVAQQDALISLMPSHAVDEAKSMAGRCWATDLNDCAPQDFLSQLLGFFGMR